mmetsp:Transcript_27526/g.70085  ORF Transcript_27526/g.70085 Transcript_27526/m.70085 type:complete len:225 (-) Transcript_27526:483-1157(-)
MILYPSFSPGSIESSSSSVSGLLRSYISRCVRISWYCSGVMGTCAWMRCSAAAAGVSMPAVAAGVAPVKKLGVMPCPTMGVAPGPRLAGVSSQRDRGFLAPPSACALGVSPPHPGVALPPSLGVASSQRFLRPGVGAAAPPTPGVASHLLPTAGVASTWSHSDVGAAAASPPSCESHRLRFFSAGAACGAAAGAAVCAACEAAASSASLRFFSTMFCMVLSISR